jgi:hypothetical protein
MFKYSVPNHPKFSIPIFYFENRKTLRTSNLKIDVLIADFGDVNMSEDN